MRHHVIWLSGGNADRSHTVASAAMAAFNGSTVHGAAGSVSPYGITIETIPYAMPVTADLIGVNHTTRSRLPCSARYSSGSDSQLGVRNFSSTPADDPGKLREPDHRLFADWIESLYQTFDLHQWGPMSVTF